MLLPIAIGVGLLIIALAFLCKKTDQEQLPSSSSTKGEQNSGQSNQSTVITMEEPAEQPSKTKKKKKKTDSSSVPAHTPKQLAQLFPQNYGSISLRSPKTLATITALAVNKRKILLANSKNQLILYDLHKWKPQVSSPQHFFTTLDNNSATAVAIGQQYYYACLDFDKTIVYYEFKGGENGVYFREIKKFQRNLFKNNQGTMHVGKNEKYIVSTGMDNDTTINVWGMNGEKLASVGSYQIQHYDIKYTNSLVLVRGWTSEIKAFQLHEDKTGAFRKIDKGFHLTLSEKPKSSVIDNLGLHAVVITEEEIIKLWKLNDPTHPNQLTIDSCQINLDNPQYCSIATLQLDNQRLRTVILIASATKMVLLDRFLKVIKEFEGVPVQELYSFGASKSAVFGSFSGGRLIVWDFTKLANEQEQYVHP